MRPPEPLHCVNDRIHRRLCAGSLPAAAAWFRRSTGKQRVCAERAELRGARRGPSASWPRLQMWKELETALSPLGAAWGYYHRLRFLLARNTKQITPVTPPSRLHSALASHLTHKHCIRAQARSRARSQIHSYTSVAFLLSSLQTVGSS